MRLTRVVPLVLGLLGLVALAGAALGAFTDWGLEQQTQLGNKSQPLFGVGQPLTASSAASITQAQALEDPTRLVTLAKGLEASVVAAGPDDGVGPNADQMVLWPPSNPTHIILVNEEGSSEPGLQKVDLATGEATILTGIDDNDPVRVTPWGTIVFGEEASDGAMDVQGKTFATGVADLAGSVPRYGESVITVPVTISAFRMARQVMGAMKGGGIDRIDYEMKGKLGSGFSPTRFATRGSFDFPQGAAPDTQ